MQQLSHHSNHKIGFWSLFAIVTGSQIGSGIFMLPANLAPFGWYALLGWIISGVGAIALALVFADLCALMPKTGGPHVYARAAFGDVAGFFTGWTYWVVSWVSTTAVIVAAVGYLTPLLGTLTPNAVLALQVVLLFAVTLLNLQGVYAAGITEFVLTVLKFVPLIVLPVFGIVYFNAQNIQMADGLAAVSVPDILSQVVLLTLWGFIGLESGTTPAGSVENPAKTIPKALVFGTIAVALVYVVNSLAIMGSMPSALLAQSKAPFADAAQYLLGGSWHLLISFIASILCLGTLNAWMLASSQIALGLAQDRLGPALLGKTNRHQAPFVALLISTFGILPLLFLTTHTTLASQLAMIIDFSVTAFLYVYVIATLAFLKKARGVQWVYGSLALVFCLWILWQTSLQTLGIAALFALSGVPVWFFKKVITN
ncbi:MAG: amino acid permease [Myxococcota bacterium]